MKVAIVHDYIKEYGGAERVLEELLRTYPKADVYTALYYPSSLGPHRARFQKYRIKESFFRYIPFAYKLISPLRVLSPLAFYLMDLSGYDVVIVSQTGAYFPNLVKTKSGNEPTIMNHEARKTNTKQNGAFHICYTHTPPRYLYGYMTAREWKKNPIVRVVAELVNHFLRIVDYHASLRVDQFIANSNEVASRIEKFYRREAKVIYPPVAVNPKSETRNSNAKEYYLAGGRLARAKGMDVILEAFIQSGKPLKIFGKGFAGYAEELIAKIKNNESRIEFVGEITDEEKLELMRGAKAYIFASFDEDFGITPVEAMSVGTPVVAYASGGVKETVVDEKTGVFYSPNTEEELNKAINKLERLKIEKSDCVAQAKKFSDQRFREEVKKLVVSLV